MPQGLSFLFFVVFLEVFVSFLRWVSYIWTGMLVHASGSYMQKHLLSTSWSVGSTPPIFKKKQANQAWNQWWIFLGNFFVIATKSPRRLVAQFLTLKMPTHQENHLGTFTTFFFFRFMIWVLRLFSISKRIPKVAGEYAFEDLEKKLSHQLTDQLGQGLIFSKSPSKKGLL